MEKSDQHVIKGMTRNMSSPQFKQEFLWDAYNIRLTTRGEGTQLSVTGELSSKKVYSSDKGILVKAVPTTDYIVLFFTDRIERIDNKFQSTLLYHQITTDKPFIDSTEDFQYLVWRERNDIEKVYWVQKTRPPRMLNVYTGTLTHDDNAFDFVANLDLKEEIIVDKLHGGGMFLPGTIQYAFTYYNKHGRQSHVFYTSLLNYISFENKGGEANKQVSNVFRITVRNWQKNFDYLRIYSIHRTSYSGQPEIKMLPDINLKEQKEDTITVFDDGTHGSLVDNTLLLYVGGDDITARTITQKDNTAFFGNLTYNDNRVETYHGELQGLISMGEYLKSYNVEYGSISSDYYQYVNMLNFGVHPAFKKGEHYRFGIQFQDFRGIWSDPVFLQDYTFKNTPREAIEDNKTLIRVPCFHVNLNQRLQTRLIQHGYRRARGVVVFPTLVDRYILAQGILCPTVFQWGARKDNKPYAQSSWFLRPSIPKKRVHEAITRGRDDTEGQYPEFRNYEQIPAGSASNAEFYADDSLGRPITDPYSDNDFLVDSSILTMHSPDVELDENFKVPDANWKLRIVGYVNFIAHVSDVDIQASSSPAIEDGGFKKLLVASTMYEKHGGKSLLGQYLWNDGIILKDTKKDTGQYYVYSPSDQCLGYSTDLKSVYYKTYPWMGGSLNNDTTRPSDQGTQSAVLKHMVQADLKYGVTTYGLDYEFNGDNGKQNGISKVQLFDSDQMSVIKVPSIFKETAIQKYNYYGNVDTLINVKHAQQFVSTVQGEAKEGDKEGRLTDNAMSSSSPRGRGTGNSANGPYVISNALYTTDRAVRIKYHSPKHLVFSLMNDSQKRMVILPNLNAEYYDSGRTKLPKTQFTWFGRDDTTIITPTYNADGAYVLSRGTLDKLFRGHWQITGKAKMLSIIDVWYDGVKATHTYYPVTIVAVGGEGGKIPYRHDPIKYTNEEETKCELICPNGGDTFQTLDENRGPFVFIGWDRTGKNYSIWDKETETINSKANKAMFTFVKSERQTGYAFSNYMLGRTLSDEPYHEIFAIFDKDFDVRQFSLGSYHNGADCIEVVQDDLKKTFGSDKDLPEYLYLAEIYRDPADVKVSFGGDSREAKQTNLWLPAGESVILDDTVTTEVEFTQGDTWYQRFDTTKTLPYTADDECSIVEIGSFMCESHINLDGRWDDNRGRLSNLYVTQKNFNLINTAYNSQDTYFNYRIYDDDYYAVRNYPNQVLWTTSKINGEQIDSWLAMNSLSIMDLDGSQGQISKLDTLKDRLFCFQENAINEILYNLQVQVQNSQGLPIELSNSKKITGKRPIAEKVGCSYSDSVAKSTLGIYFQATKDKQIYLLAEGQQAGVASLSEQKGFNDWVSSGDIQAFYDGQFDDLYFFKDTQNLEKTLCYSERLSQFTSFYGYTDQIINFQGETYNVTKSDNSIYKMWAGEPQQNLFVTIVSNQSPTDGRQSETDVFTDKTFSTVEFTADVYDGSMSDINMNLDGKKSPVCPFNYMRVFNEYQDTHKVPLTYRVCKPSALKKKFRIWRAQVGRDFGTLDRIRNPWAYITLGTDNNKHKIVLHNINVHYF